MARDNAAGPSEYYWRAGVIHAYYALILECHDALAHWGFVVPRRDSMHAWVRLRFAYARDATLRNIGDALDQLVRARNKASYNLLAKDFTSDATAHQAIQEAVDALALLDQIDGDPNRRAAAVASITP